MYVFAIIVMEHILGGNYFSIPFFMDGQFFLSLIVLTIIAVVPVTLLLVLERKLNPPIYTKLK